MSRKAVRMRTPAVKTSPRPYLVVGSLFCIAAVVSGWDAHAARNSLLLVLALLDACIGTTLLAHGMRARNKASHR